MRTKGCPKGVWGVCANDAMVHRHNRETDYILSDLDLIHFLWNLSNSDQRVCFS